MSKMIQPEGLQKLYRPNKEEVEKAVDKRNPFMAIFSLKDNGFTSDQIAHAIYVMLDLVRKRSLHPKKVVIAARTHDENDRQKKYVYVLAKDEHMNGVMKFFTKQVMDVDLEDGIKKGSIVDGITENRANLGGWIDPINPFIMFVDRTMYMRFLALVGVSLKEMEDDEDD